MMSTLAAVATRLVDRRRRGKAVGTGIDDTIDKDHPGASDTVARPLSVTSCQLRCDQTKRQDVSAGQSRLTHFRFVKNPLLPTFDTTLGPRSQTLEQIGETGAMVLRTRMPHGADAEACSLQRRTREEGRTVKTFTENYCSSHLDEARKPRGATRNPRGRS